MFNQYLSSIDRIAIYPVISLILFFVLFVMLIIWVIRLKKEYIEQMEQLPFSNDTEINYEESNRV